MGVSGAGGPPAPAGTPVRQPQPLSPGELLPHAVSGRREHTDECGIPFPVIKIVECRLQLLPEPAERGTIGNEGAPVQHPPGPPAMRIENEEAPAAVIAADVGPRQVDRAPCLPGLCVKSEEGACFRQMVDAAPVFIQGNLVRVYPYLLHIPGVVVADDKGVIATFLCYGVDELHVAAAVAALAALTRDGGIPPDHQIVRYASPAPQIPLIVLIA